MLNRGDGEIYSQCHIKNTYLYMSPESYTKNMSLIVTIVDNMGMHICADLRIVQPETRPKNKERHIPNFFNGVLKIVPVSKSLAIAYAGAVSIGLEAIREVKKSGDLSSDIPGRLIQILEDKADTSQCDFIVFDAAEHVIYRIKNGEITELRNGRTWIGDVDAYALFQKELEKSGFDEGLNVFAKGSMMMNALEAVINENSIENVGEYPLAMLTHDGEIQPVVSFKAQGPTQLRPGLNPITFSNNPNVDSLIINTLVPVERGVAAIGLYLNKFQKGALYLPLERDEPFIVDGKTIEEFRKKVESEHGVELLGGGFE